MGLFASPGVVEKSWDGSASCPCCSPASTDQLAPQPQPGLSSLVGGSRFPFPQPRGSSANLTFPHCKEMANSPPGLVSMAHGSLSPLASPQFLLCWLWLSPGEQSFIFPGREPLGFSIWVEFSIPPLTPCWGHPWVLTHPFSIGCGGFLEGSDILLLLCQGINHSHLLSVVSRNISGSCNSIVQFLFCFLVSCQKTAFVVPLCKTLVGSLLGPPRRGLCWSHKIIFGFCCSVPDPGWNPILPTLGTTFTLG